MFDAIVDWWSWGRVNEKQFVHWSMVKIKDVGRMDSIRTYVRAGGREEKKVVQSSILGGGFWWFLITLDIRIYCYLFPMFNVQCLWCVQIVWTLHMQITNRRQQCHIQQKRKRKFFPLGYVSNVLWMYLCTYIFVDIFLPL